MAKKALNVADYLQALEHARKDEIEDLRALVLAAAEGLTEQIKWNAPSYGFAGEDWITFRLQPGDRVELVFHRGAKSRDDGTFRFEDDSRLLEWAAADRAIVRFADRKDLQAKKPALTGLVRAWLAATR